MREQQKHFEDVRNAEIMEAQRMEQAELRKKQEFERRKQNEREKRKNKIAAHKKLVARTIAKKYNTGMKDYTYKHLADVSYFTNSFKNNVLEQNVLPWLQTKVEQFVAQLGFMNEFPDTFLNDHLTDFEKEHQATVAAEHQRLENVRLLKEQQEREKEEEKRKRRAAREAIKKANELKKLKQDINVNFVEKGEHRENILL